MHGALFFKLAHPWSYARQPPCGPLTWDSAQGEAPLGSARIQPVWTDVDCCDIEASECVNAKENREQSILAVR